MAGTVIVAGPSHKARHASGGADALSPSDIGAVAKTGAETVAGVKTFSSAPVVPDSSFTVAKTTGLQADLDAKADADALADVATTGSYTDLTGNAPFATALYNTGTSSWPARPAALSVEWIGADESHPPTGALADVDIWIRDAS